MTNICLLLAYLLALLLNIHETRVLPEDASIFSSEILPLDTRLWATISNGYIGTYVLSDTLYISGVYNGFDHYNNNSNIAHRARISSTNAIDVLFPDFNITEIKTNYSLDVNNAVFTVTKTSKTSSYFSMKQEIYAHREMKNLLVTQITIDNTKNDQDLTMTLINNAGRKSEDIDFKEIECINSNYNTTCKMGSTLYSESNADLITIVLIYFEINPVEHTIIIPKNVMKTYYFPTLITTSLEYPIDTILSTTINIFNNYYKMKDEWLNKHIAEWNNIWLNGRIDIIGDTKDASNVYSSLYYIISSIRSDWPYGLSPGSLATNGYNGHIFWDQETWMFPSLAILHSNLSKSCLEYRYNRIRGSKFNANYTIKDGLNNTLNLTGSYKFAWESAFTGIECLPLWANTGVYEVHINADIGLAIKQYYYLTHNKTWLKYYGYDMINGICSFWYKWWSSYNNTNNNNKYEWFNVMPPDEYHYPVNNSVYTNNAAKTIFKFGIEAANILNMSYPSIWNDIINNTYYPFDKTLNYYPEYDGYNISIQVKQGDVILLSFPWDMNISDEIIENDLNIYQQTTTQNGPAMTWSMFLINWLSIAQFEKADSFFKKSYENIQSPFKIWTETSNGGGTTNFITGAGGFLQSFIFGYGAIRIRSNNLFINFNHLPNNWKQLNLIGVDYLDNSINLLYYKQNLSMDITIRNRNSLYGKPLQIVFNDNSIQKLFVNQTIQILNTYQPIKIQPIPTN